MINKLLVFFGSLVLIFSVLFAVMNYSGGEDVYLQFLRDISSKVFNSEKQIAIFKANNDYAEWDTKLIVYRTDIQENGEFQYYSTRYLSYISLLIFLSLVTASPINWFRKYKGYFFGIILMLVYSNLMTGVIVRKLVYEIKKIAGTDYSSFLSNFNDTIFDVFIVHGFEWMGLIPLVLWFITTIKLKDFDISLKSISQENIKGI